MSAGPLKKTVLIVSRRASETRPGDCPAYSSPRNNRIGSYKIKNRRESLKIEFLPEPQEEQKKKLIVI